MSCGRMTCELLEYTGHVARSSIGSEEVKILDNLCIEFVPT